MKTSKTNYMSIMMLILFVMSSFAVNATTTKEKITKEDRVKGLVIFSMIKYIQLPENSEELVIGILTDNQETVDLFNEIAANRSSYDKKIIIKSFTSVAAATRNSDILFIPNENSAQIANIGAKEAQNVLIITEKEGLCQQGSAINLITVDGKLRFEINKKAVEQSAIKVSTKLTQMGIEV